MRRSDFKYDILNNQATTVATSKRPYSVKIITLSTLEKALNALERQQRIVLKQHALLSEKALWGNDNNAIQAKQLQQGKRVASYY
jgi:hypothetical protein